jgi:hypothetical protein
MAAAVNYPNGIKIKVNQYDIKWLSTRNQSLMNHPAAPSSGIAASLRQATGYQPEYFYRPKGRGIHPSSASGGLNLYPPLEGSSAAGGLTPGFDFIRQIFFDITDGNFPAVKNTGGQGSFRLGSRKDFIEVFNYAGSAGGNDRNGNCRCNGIDQLKVKAQIGSVTIDTIE